MTLSIKISFKDWFRSSGAHVLVDGQFGSTGKGLLAGAIAEEFWSDVQAVTTNAGPNSGHTAYLHDRKIVLNQLPMFSVVADKICSARGVPNSLITYLNAGALIDPDILRSEVWEHSIPRLYIDPCAAKIDDDSRMLDEVTENAIASTGKGTGPALARKVSRVSSRAIFGPVSVMWPFLDRPEFRRLTTFIEVSQGFSLGINSGFYPHVTSRECTVAQALSDAGISPRDLRKTVMCVRTFPIRTGDTANSSGPCYPDQTELDWSEFDVEPELSTTTKRIRRVFSWSDRQFKQSLIANNPDVIFVNFCQYLDHMGQSVDDFVRGRVLEPYTKILGRKPDAILLGYGPRSSDIYPWE